jgi:hypothetical protein
MYFDPEGSIWRGICGECNWEGPISYSESQAITDSKNHIIDNHPIEEIDLNADIEATQ